MRKIWAVTAFHRRFNRCPDLDEALDYYEEYCHHTGPRDGERTRQMKNAIAAHEATFDPAASGQHAVSLGRYLDLIQKLIPASELYYHKSKEKTVPLIYSDIDVFVNICTSIAFSRSSHDRMLRASRSRIQGYFAKLKTEGKHPTACHNAKYTRLFNLCCQHGLLEMYSGYQPPQYNGRKKVKGYGRLLGPGQQHPLHAQFQGYICLFNLPDMGQGRMAV